MNRLGANSALNLPWGKRLSKRQFSPNWYTLMEINARIMVAVA